MSEFFSRGSDQTLTPIEQTILAAGQFVRVSDNLRPRTIEAAKDVACERIIKRGASISFLVWLVIVSLIIPTLAWLVEHNLKSSTPSSWELHQQAMELSANRVVGANWGLSEVVMQLRLEQANRFKQMNTGNRN